MFNMHNPKKDLIDAMNRDEVIFAKLVALVPVTVHDIGDMEDYINGLSAEEIDDLVSRL